MDGCFNIKIKSYFMLTRFPVGCNLGIMIEIYKLERLLLKCSRNYLILYGDGCYPHNTRYSGEYRCLFCESEDPKIVSFE